MLKLSVAEAPRGSKAVYKGYMGIEVETMARVGEYAREYSISSYVYGRGTTDGGEECEGHRAGASVIRPGSVLLFDFDNKGATFEEICDRLANVSAWIGPSKSWSESVLKFHAVVELDRVLPMDKEQFRLWHRAAAQWFGFDGLHDPAMESWTQQMAPHWHPAGAAPERVVAGQPLNMDDVLAAYRPGESGVRVGKTLVSGRVPADAEFVCSRDGEVLDVRGMMARAARETKVRVHCLRGILHDGRRDTALVRCEKGAYFYHCTGGRCGHTLEIVEPTPFDELPDEGSAPAKSKGGGLLDGVLDRVAGSAHAGAFGKKATKDIKAEAAGYGGQEMLMDADVRRFAGYIRRWNGRKWEVMFEDDDAVYRFAQKVCLALGLEDIAYNNSRLTGIARHLRGSVAVPRDAKLSGDLINLNNGMIRIDPNGVALLPHDREALFTTCLPFDYQPLAICPTWEVIARRVMMDDPELVTALQDAMGYLMLRTLNVEKMIGFVGEGENGKSTVQTVLKMLLGTDGYSAQPLHKLTHEGSLGEYARAALEGKWVNFTNELSPKDLSSEEFKNLISGEDIAAREPYGKPFVIRHAPKQLAAMNTTDKLVKEQTHGFQRRLHLIPFDYRIKPEDKDPLLWQKLQAELPGIFNWVLEGSLRVARARRLTEAQRMCTLKDNVLRDANNVQQFMEECCHLPSKPFASVENDERPKAVVGVNELYLHYKNFAGMNGYFPLGRNRFAAELERLGAEKVRETLRVKGVVHRVSGFYLIVDATE